MSKESKEVKNLRNKRRRDRLVDAGLCAGCGLVPPEIGLKKCRKCLNVINVCGKQWKLDNIAAGLCRCGAVKENGLSVCAKCEDAKLQLHYSDTLAAYDYYGGRYCACCGESMLEFLNIDHIAGGGNVQVRRGTLPAWLKSMGYPPGYQILCSNCNFGKSRNGNVLVNSDTLYVCDCRGGCKGNKLCEHGLTYTQRYLRRRTLATYNAYGGMECVCCGVNIPFYLTMDHGFDDGKEHRDEVGNCIATWAFQNYYPQDAGLRVMCANCNYARDDCGGVCPHRVGGYLGLYRYLPGVIGDVDGFSAEEVPRFN